MTSNKKEMKEFSSKLAHALVDDDIQRTLVQTLGPSIIKAISSNRTLFEPLGKKLHQFIQEQQQASDEVMAKASDVRDSGQADLSINPSIVKSIVQQEMSSRFPPKEEQQSSGDVSVLNPWYNQGPTRWHNLVTSNFEIASLLASHAVLLSEPWAASILTQMELGGMNISKLTLGLVLSFLKTHHQTRSLLMDKFAPAYTTIRSNLQTKDRMALHRERRKGVLKSEPADDTSPTPSSTTPAKERAQTTLVTQSPSETPEKSPIRDTKSPVRETSNDSADENILGPESAYERQRQENIKHNQEVLEQLGLRASPVSKRVLAPENVLSETQNTTGEEQNLPVSGSKKRKVNPPKETVKVRATRNTARDQATKKATAGSFY